MRGIVTIDRQPGSDVIAVWASSRVGGGYREQELDGEKNDRPNGTDTRPVNVNAVVIDTKTDPEAMKKMRSLVFRSIVVATEGSSLAGLPIDLEPLRISDLDALADEAEEQQQRILDALDIYATRISPKTGAVLKPKPVARPRWMVRPSIYQFPPQKDTPAMRALATADYICAVWRYWLSTDEERRSRVDSPPRMTPELSSPIVPDFPPGFEDLLRKRERV
jgi:hypothetical protein